MEFNAFFADYLNIKSHAVGDSTTDEHKMRVAIGLKELSEFVANQNMDHPTLSVIDGLWDYLVDESVVVMFDDILETIPVGDDKNDYLRNLSSILLQDVLTFHRPDICGHGESGCG